MSLYIKLHENQSLFQQTTPQGGHVMKKVLKNGKRGNKKESLVVYEEILNLDDSSSRIELIQLLIPVGLQAIEEELQSEVMR